MIIILDEYVNLQRRDEQRRQVVRYFTLDNIGHFSVYHVNKCIDCG